MEIFRSIPLSTHLFMIQAIIDFLRELFSFAEKIADNKAKKIDLQEAAVREQGDTKEIKERLRQDKKLDRELRKEPKVMYEFSDSVEFRKCAEGALYFGNKEDIILFIKRDSGNALSWGQSKELIRQVKKSKHLFFVVKIDPLTVHKEIN